MTRAKFECVYVEVKQGDQSWHYKEGNAEPLDVVNVTLQAVVPDSEENKQFFASTPSGQITLSILRPEAVTWFEKGKKYYVDFTSAQ
jgi:hypothetical protein